MLRAVAGFFIFAGKLYYDTATPPILDLYSRYRFSLVSRESRSLAPVLGSLKKSVLKRVGGYIRTNPSNRNGYLSVSYFQTLFLLTIWNSVRWVISTMRYQWARSDISMDTAFSVVEYRNRSLLRISLIILNKSVKAKEMSGFPWSVCKIDTLLADKRNARRAAPTV